MSEQDDFDARLAAHFEQEHRHAPADSFVADIMRKVRAERRSAEVIRTGLRVAALVAAVVASPWLSAGAARLNATLETTHPWTLGLPGAWILGALIVGVVVAARVRGR